jgi:hypothetical protein
MCCYHHNQTEEAVKFVCVTADGDGGTVGYLPQAWKNLPIVKENINIFCIVRELFEHSENRCKRLKSHRNVGMAGVYYSALCLLRNKDS